jgi:septum formation topological specificity factor MinE
MKKLLKKFFNKKRRTNTDLKEKINYLIETDRKDSAPDV